MSKGNTNLYSRIVVQCLSHYILYKVIFKLNPRDHSGHLLFNNWNTSETKRKKVLFFL